MKIPIPKEHGAWVMLYTPLLAVIVILQEFPFRLFLFLLSVTAFFFTHGPLFTLVRLNPGQPDSAATFKRSRLWLVLYACLAAFGMGILLWKHDLRLLLPIGIVFAGLLLWQTYLTKKHSEKTRIGEILAVTSLTFSGPCAWYVITRTYPSLSWYLWILNVLFFMSSIFYVKMLVARAAGKQNQRKLAFHCGLFHLALALVIPLLIWQTRLPAILIVGFLPVIFRAFWKMIWADRKLNLKKIGLEEIGYSLFFLLILVWGFRTEVNFSAGEGPG